jgi:uncharacterized protein
VGCRGKAGKADLLRLVVERSGAVRVDPRGTEPGRGAYVHRNAACVDAALKRGSIARALRTGLGAEEAARLRADIGREVVD